MLERGWRLGSEIEFGQMGGREGFILLKFGSTVRLFRLEPFDVGVLQHLISGLEFVFEDLSLKVSPSVETAAIGG